LNVGGNPRQVVPELMAATVNCPCDGARNPCAVKRQVRERDDVVIATVVEDDSRD
jgi:hypothetical protein